MSGSSGYTLYVPKPREITSDAGNSYPNELSWGSIADFLKERSFRRIFYVAGGASVFFAAWYLFRRLNERNQLECVISTASVPGNESVLRYSLEESFNNNADLPGEKVMAEGPPVEDKVVIHCCPRGFFVPSIATEPLKLETFLRVANIPYEVNFCNEFETPFLTYGEKIGNDFRECIRILSEKFDVNLEGKDVSASRKTASHLVDISLENHFSWAILIWRWIFDEGKSMKKIHAMNALGEEVVPEVSQRVKDATKYHPIGQLDKTEFVKTINQGIHDISAALGKHKFFQGQTPGLVDCHAFAILVQIMWNMPDSPFESQLKKYGNLVDFVKRMKEKYWPDWNELILKPQEFDENFNAALRHHRSSASNSRTRKSSRSREPGENSVEINGAETHLGSEEETGAANTKASGYSVSNAEKKLPDPEVLKTVLSKKEGIHNESSHANTGDELEAVSASVQSQPTGILKTGVGVTNSANVAKPRSGFVSASAGSTKFPVEQVSHASDPSLVNNIESVPPTHVHHVQPQQQTRQQESMMHVHKPSVKFANVASAESTTVHQQIQQPQEQQSVNLNNGNFQRTIPPQSPMRTPYPTSAAELSKKRSVERQPPHPEQFRHSLMQQQQYANYTHPQQPQRQQLKNGALDDFHRAHNNSHSHAQYYHQPPTHTPPSTYGQPSYPVTQQMFNSQSIPGSTPPSYPQQMHYAPTSIGHSENDDGIQSQPPFSHHHTLNPEQMQKAAQAHLDAYYQHHQRQQYQQHQQQSPYNNNYHTGLVPSFVAPPFDPRNPAAALLRF